MCRAAVLETRLAGICVSLHKFVSSKLEFNVQINSLMNQQIVEGTRRSRLRFQQIVEGNAIEFSRFSRQQH